MDLTKEYPRSVRDKVHGVVQLGRAIDKGKAVAHGNAGEYNYDCPMDDAVFTFLGIDGKQMLDVIKNSKGDEEVLAYTKPFVDKKSPQEIEAWNEAWLKREPEGESKEHFEGMRAKIAPDRTDVKSWADLLDLDEKRPVPQRTPA